MDNGLFGTIYNPDVLSCLANLSNDEVFTPPEVVNQVLDMLPQELFSNPDTTFLDPACKTGVFLREIAKRLIKGLEPQIPDLQERVDHIFQKQLYGIAITELTSLLSRRGVYCSKYPNSEYSVSKFEDKHAQGNIRFKRIQHGWQKGKCVFCGASESEYERGEDLETHAYEWIHTLTPERIFNMKFDVIVGNPPYQLSDSGHGASAMPIYQKFVTQAKALKPRYLSMIIPARWFAGGRGLDDFRKEMLHDKRIKVMHDFLKSSDCFPGVQIEGGICYFLWDRDYSGDCLVTTHQDDKEVTCLRPLLEDGANIFIRSGMQLSVFKKVQAKKDPLFYDIVSANDPFGFDVREQGGYKRIKPTFELKSFPGAVTFFYFGWNKEGVGYVDRKYIRKNPDLINKWKVYISRAYGMGDTYPTQVINKPFVGEPNSCCTETYLCIGPFNSKEEAENAVSYIQTKFFRFLVMLIKSTQQAMKPVYEFVPMQDFSKPWTDQELYEKYGLTKEEIEHIENLVKPMGMDEGENNG